jgi:MoaA/NifB/PqqE/SkfB family radical SAM enzyme
MNGQDPRRPDAEDARTRFRNLVQETRALRRRQGLPDVGERIFLLKLDTGNQCNLQCKHCGVHLIRDVVHPVSMDARLRQILVRDVFPFCHEVCLGSLAEPLMSSHLDEMLEQGRTQGVPFLQVVTNALLLDELRIRAWIRLPLDLVSVSLDAASPVTYTRLRGGDFRAVVANVARLRDLKRRLGADRPRLRVNFVVMRSNLREMPAMVDLAHELGAEILEFSLPFLDRRLGLEDELPLSDRALWETVMQQTRQRMEARGLPRVVLPEVPDAPGGGSSDGPLSPGVGSPRRDRIPLCLAP